MFETTRGTLASFCVPDNSGGLIENRCQAEESLRKALSFHAICAKPDKQQQSHQLLLPPFEIIQQSA